MIHYFIWLAWRDTPEFINNIYPVNIIYKLKGVYHVEN